MFIDWMPHKGLCPFPQIDKNNPYVQGEEKEKKKKPGEIGEIKIK